jgi:6,7-dimethyl-8-ribityllumazine synthase
MNEIEIKLAEEEITCVIAALGMTMDTTGEYRVIAQEIIRKIMKEQFADAKPIKVNVVTSISAKGKMEGK